jgi:predicted HAD superfamily Cof-like phosphohydrolase
MNGAALLQEDVNRFMRAMGQTVRGYPQTPPDEERKLRIRLVTEEFDETIDALIELGNPSLSRGRELDLLAELADGIADLVYVLVGTASTFGITLNDVWEAVQNANLAKTKGAVREDGKRLKPPGWAAPNIQGIIAEQVAEHKFADNRISGPSGLEPESWDDSGT